MVEGFHLTPTNNSRLFFSSQKYNNNFIDFTAELFQKRKINLNDWKRNMEINGHYIQVTPVKNIILYHDFTCFRLIRIH